MADRILIHDRPSSMELKKRLRVLGIDASRATGAFSNYAPFKQVGEFLFVSGQLPVHCGIVQYQGRLGESLTAKQGYLAARLCGINLIQQALVASGEKVSRIKGCVKLVGFVNSADDFTEQADVINGASDLMVEVFGDAGHHTRSAVGVNVLPLEASVEIEAVFVLRG